MMVRLQVNHFGPTKLKLECPLVAEVNATVAEGPKNKYERLENRISSPHFSLL